MRFFADARDLQIFKDSWHRVRSCKSLLKWFNDIGRSSWSSRYLEIVLKKQERNNVGESQVYKVEIWIRTDVDIRVIVSVARASSPFLP